MFINTSNQIGVGTNVASNLLTVGINTSLPGTGAGTTRLLVYGNIGLYQNRVCFNTTTTAFTDSIYNNNQNLDGLGAFNGFKYNSNSGHYFGVGAVSGSTVPTSMYINGSRLVGIGTATVNGALHLYETGTAPSATTGSIYLQHGNASGSSSIVFKSSGTSDYGSITFNENATNPWGTATSILQIGVSGGAGNDHVIFNPAGNVAFLPAGALTYFSGRVGIGTYSAWTGPTTTAAMLYVNGAARFDSYVTVANANINSYYSAVNIYAVFISTLQKNYTSQKKYAVASRTYSLVSQFNTYNQGRRKYFRSEYHVCLGGGNYGCWSYGNRYAPIPGGYTFVCTVRDLNCDYWSCWYTCRGYNDSRYGYWRQTSPPPHYYYVTVHKNYALASTTYSRYYSTTRGADTFNISYTPDASFTGTPANSTTVLVARTTSGSLNTLAIYAKGGDIVVSGTFYFSSDYRIKTNIRPASGLLDILRKLRFVSHDYLESSRHCPIGLIAQDVQEIYPEAIRLSSDYVPNILSKPALSFEDGVAVFTFPSAVDVEEGDLLKYTVIHKGESKEYTETVLFSNGNVLHVSAWPEADLADQVSVYGKQVDDFHHLDKTSIAMLGLGALKQVHRTAKDQKKLLDNMESSMTDMETTLSSMMTQMKALQTRFSMR